MQTDMKLKGIFLTRKIVNVKFVKNVYRLSKPPWKTGID